MAQAILVKYLGPTNTKGARLIARAWFGSLRTAYYHHLSPAENHERAAHALCTKHDRPTALLGAQLPGNLGYAYIMSPIEEPLT